MFLFSLKQSAKHPLHLDHSDICFPRYPTKDWKLAVQDEMTEERAVQSFNVEDAEGYFAKFVRVELLDHYSNEHFCPLTLFR